MTRIIENTIESFAIELLDKQFRQCRLPILLPILIIRKTTENSDQGQNQGQNVLDK
jgi:hypothetical protein